MKILRTSKDMRIILICNGDNESNTTQSLSQKGVEQANKTKEFLAHKITDQCVLVAQSDLSDETARRIFANHAGIELRMYTDIDLVKDTITTMRYCITNFNRLLDQCCKKGKDIYVVGNSQFLSLFVCSKISDDILHTWHLNRICFSPCSITTFSYVDEMFTLHQLGKVDHLGPTHRDMNML